MTGALSNYIRTGVNTMELYVADNKGANRSLVDDLLGTYLHRVGKPKAATFIIL